MIKAAILKWCNKHWPNAEIVDPGDFWFALDGFSCDMLLQHDYIYLTLSRDRIYYSDPSLFRKLGQQRKKSLMGATT